MKNLLFVLLFSVIGFAAQAQAKNKNAKHQIEVKGNCDQCKKRIEKAALSVSGVKSASWDIESQKLQLIINEEKTDVESVQNAIAKAGHDSDGTKATDEAYENLHHCCKYER